MFSTADSHYSLKRKGNNMKTMKNFIQKVFKGDPMIWGYVMLS